MNPTFECRRDAGRPLGKELRLIVRRDGPKILALPRGGVPVAFEIALALDAPLDVFTVRKLGVPGHEELAMGAIATGGIRALNEEVVRSLEIPAKTIEMVASREERELHRREECYRHDHAAPAVKNRTVLLVDDGAATGSTMFAAVQAIKSGEPGRVVVALPVASKEAAHKLRTAADKLFVFSAPDPFFGVGHWYQDFSQTTDDEVLEFLRIARENTTHHRNPNHRQRA